MSTVPTSEVLNRAADLIESRGWVQGSAGMIIATDSPLCLQGAIGAAAGMAESPDARHSSGAPVYDYLVTQTCPAGDAVRAYLGYGKPWMWNDHHERTATEVIEVLRAVAVIEAAREESRAEVTA